MAGGKSLGRTGNLPPLGTARSMVGSCISSWSCEQVVWLHNPHEIRRSVHDAVFCMSMSECCVIGCVWCVAGTDCSVVRVFRSVLAATSSRSFKLITADPCSRRCNNQTQCQWHHRAQHRPSQPSSASARRPARLRYYLPPSSRLRR